MNDPFYSPKQDRHLRLVPEEDLLAARKKIAALEAQNQTMREALLELSNAVTRIQAWDDETRVGRALDKAEDALAATEEKKA